MSRLILFNKPYGVLSQFTPEGRWRGLQDFIVLPGVYVAGRLDADSEGLLLLTDEAGLNERLLHPRHGHSREYWVQIERIPTDKTLAELTAGLRLGDHDTLPCRATRLDPAPEIPHRDPPIRVRKTVPDCWLSLELTEGKNRQVRRMTAAVGHPTLRLLRVRIGELTLPDLSLTPGQWRELTATERQRVLA